MAQNTNYGVILAIVIVSELQGILAECRGASEPVMEEVLQRIGRFLAQPVSPQTAYDFEKDLERLLREAGRRILEVVYNGLEPEEPEGLPKRFVDQQQEYRRKNEKTNNRGGIGTLFGTVVLRRFSCVPLQEAKDDGQPSFAPLERQLGIVGGNATPALAERVALLAAGHSQGEVLQRLAEDYGVWWSVAVLRKVTAAVSEGVAEHLHQAQKAQVLEWLRKAHGTKGRYKIVLGVGRDGIMLPIRGETTYKEGAVATIAVYDRRRRRLGTVYLGQMPEAYQATLSDQLTRLLTELLQEWTGCWPRLVFVTDAGYHPTEYFDNVLKEMEDPRCPGRRLQWTRVVDFYHACEYLGKLADVLFEDSGARHGWLKRMTHWLKHEWNAVFRILHSAAKHWGERVLSKAQQAVYQKAYNYLNTHRQWMDYREYRRQGLPIGSGVTEAACKTVFTQRFKESGMSWKIDGGQAILVLRLAKLSGIWKAVYREFLSHRPMAILPTNRPFQGTYYFDCVCQFCRCFFRGAKRLRFFQ
jgi:hypothetical protein